VNEGINRNEARVAKAFDRHGLTYVQSAHIGPYEVDFRLGDKVVVEVDGYSHLTVTAGRRDQTKDRYLSELGFTVLRIEGTAVHSDLEQFVDRVRAALKAERSRVSNDRAPSPFETADLARLRDNLAAAEAPKVAKKAEPEPEDDSYLFREWVGEEVKPPRTRRK
jgi:very-short-patch-repair endonuclease